MDQQTFHQRSYYMYTIGENFTYTGTIIFIYQNLNSYRMVMNGNCIISLMTAFICCLLTIIKLNLSGLNILQRLCQLIQLWIWYFVPRRKSGKYVFIRHMHDLYSKCQYYICKKDTNLEMELIIKEVSLEETWTI